MFTIRYEESARQGETPWFVVTKKGTTVLSAIGQIDETVTSLTGESVCATEDVSHLLRCLEDGAPLTLRSDKNESFVQIRQI